MTNSVCKDWVIILIGPPGSGKGTQADMMAQNCGFYHFEISKMLEEKFAHIDSHDEKLKHELQLWKNGELVDPEIISKWAIEGMEKAAKNGNGLVTSGNPRTISEAEQEMPTIEKLYAKENIHIIHLNLDKEESIRRNSKRRICEANRHPIPNLPEYEGITACPIDGSKIMTRILDTPETISVRYEVYLRRTQPMLSFLKERGYNILEIKGDQEIDKVHQDILEALHLND